MNVASLSLVWLSFALLCLAMPRHCMDILPGRKLIAWQKQLLQLLGAVSLVCSAAVAINSSGIGLGLTIWTGQLTLALVLLALLLTYRPGWLRASCASAILGIVVSVALL